MYNKSYDTFEELRALYPALGRVMSKSDTYALLLDKLPVEFHYALYNLLLTVWEASAEVYQ